MLQGRLRGGEEKKKAKVRAVHAALDANLQEYKKKKCKKRGQKVQVFPPKKMHVFPADTLAPALR